MSAAFGRNEGANRLEASLGKLVKFDLREKAPSTAKRQSGGAQIFIFTGVRYERGTPSLPTKRLAPSRPKRKRG